MSLIRDERDIIIVTGCNAVGKTTTSNYFRNYASSHNILHENTVVADSHFLFKAMRWDDNAGGFHHTHDWCEEDSVGHAHTHNQPEFPFTITDNELPERMRIHFFTRLTELPKTGKIWFVEWAGGANTNSTHDSKSAAIDYSYTTVNRLLRRGDLPLGWLERVFAIIHLSANYRVRFLLNEHRTLPPFAQPEEIEQGTAFWQKNETVLQFYGHDDFYGIQSLFIERDIPIYNIENDRGDCFYKCLDSVAGTLFLPSRATLENISLTCATSSFPLQRDVVNIATTEELVASTSKISLIETDEILI